MSSSTLMIKSAEDFVLKTEVLKRANLTPLQRLEIDNALAAHSKPDEFTQDELLRMRQRIADHWHQINSSTGAFIDLISRLDLFAYAFACLLVRDYCENERLAELDLDSTKFVTVISSLKREVICDLLNENADITIEELCMDRPHLEYRLCSATENIIPKLIDGDDRTTLAEVVKKDRQALNQVVTHSNGLEPVQHILEGVMQRLTGSASTAKVSSTWSGLLGFLGLTDQAPSTRPSRSLQSFAVMMTKKQL